MHQLENLAEMLGIEIRHETIENEMPFSPGGLCRLGDRYILILNKALRKQDKIQTLGRAVTRFDLSNVYLRPGLRVFLSELKGERRDSEK